MSRIRPAKFAHVVHRTRRFEMVAWYETVFDARVQYRNPALAFLTKHDERHRFAFAKLAVLQPDGAETDRVGVIGVDHVAYTDASLSDLFENYLQLQQERIAPYWCFHHGITVSTYYADPDGKQMEFQVDSYGSNDEANALMHGLHFDINPIGVEYDPQDWLVRLRHGAPAAELLIRKIHGPVSPLGSPMAN